MLDIEVNSFDRKIDIVYETLKVLIDEEYFLQDK